MVLHEAASSKRIDVIFDVYRESSIKNAEREQRDAEYGNELRNLQPDHKVQQWRRFLLNPQNNTALTKFVAKEGKQDKCRRKLEDKVLFVAFEEECHQISSDDTFSVEDLNSNQTKTHILSYRLKHSVMPRRIPTESIVSSVEAVLSRQNLSTITSEADLLPRYNLYLTIT